MYRNSAYTSVRVINTPLREAPDGFVSWFEYWKHVTGSHRTTCCAIGCSDWIYDCAVVNVVDGRYGNKWYLIPFCITHFMSSDEIPIDSRVSLVSARVDLVERRDKRKKTIKPSFQQYHSNADDNNDYDNSSEQRYDYEAELRVYQQMLKMEQQREQRQKEQEEKRRQAFSEILNSGRAQYQTRTGNKEEIDPCAFVCAMIMLVIIIPIICN